MKRAIFFLFLIFVLIDIWSQPGPARSGTTIVIDTDCGVDDFRAMSLLLSRPEIAVKGIITSEGSLSPSEGREKVNSLLYEKKRDEIPVVSGKDLPGIDPVWRGFNRNISWGRRMVQQDSDLNVTDLLIKMQKESKEKLTIVCLGPLTNINDAIKNDPSVVPGIERIIWYNESLKPLAGFNYECDRESATSVLNSKIRIDIISSLDYDNALFDTSFVSVCLNSKTDLAGILKYVFCQPGVTEKMNENHFKLADDLVAIYITNPELFAVSPDADKLNIRYVREYSLPEVSEVFKDMIRGVYVQNRNIVFNIFPLQRELYNYDVRPIIDTAIERYGYEEWKANVLTDEFHRHLGVFSIVGAKMGIKAREFFDAGPDMLEVTTFAGTRPPYSCLNDGIQVSTGATLGMGTIHIATKKKVSPEAIFTYKGRALRISLKKEYIDKIDSDINEGITKFGLQDDGYWKLIRRNALKYWVEWDRNKIFDIEEITRKR